MSTLLQQLNTETASIVEDVAKALVEVRSGGGGIGAGTIWHPDGLIVTNAHTVQRYPLTVGLVDGRTLAARLLACDQTLDLAALALEAAGLPTVKPGQSRTLQPGQWVLALGHPWGLRGAVTVGVVIGTGHQWSGMPPSGPEWVVVSLHPRPGYSGGPLLDVNGRLIGINTIMNGPDVGMAVPVHLVKAFLHDALGSLTAA